MKFYTRPSSKQLNTSHPTLRTVSGSTQEFPVKPLVLVIVIICLLILLVCLVQSCSQKTYDWSNLSYNEEEGRYEYIEQGKVISYTGIDVSSYQGSVDWEQVATDDIDFAMLRCGWRGSTQGSIYEDETFQANAEGATNAGIPFGVYFFSQAISEEEAEEEASYVLDAIEDMDIQGPIAYDFELLSDSTGRATGLSSEQVSANAEAFCSVIEDAGYDVLVYGNQTDLERYDLNTLRHDIWYADYSSDEPDINSGIAMWQYSATAQVAGISTEVDLNILFDTSLIN